MAPASGGLHAVELLLQRRGRDNALELFHYNARAHAIELLDVKDSRLSKLWEIAQAAIPIKKGSVIWLLADLALISAGYRNAESLVWRDAGVLVGYSYVVAEALGLTCCALGPTGEPVLSTLFDSERMTGCGGIIIGSA